MCVIDGKFTMILWISILSSPHHILILYRLPSLLVGKVAMPESTVASLTIWNSAWLLYLLHGKQICIELVDDEHGISSHTGGKT